MVKKVQDPKDVLMDDFRTIIEDAEELLKVTAHQTGEKISAVRERAEENLRAAQLKLSELEDDLMDQAKAAVKATDQLIHENPWQSVAVATAVGVMLGMLISRR